MIFSYAQNFEDIMLWRALKTVDNGFYVDVGSGGPEKDSVTQLFYEHGWSGINIEPSHEDFEKLKSKRIRDVNLPYLITSEIGEAEYWEAELGGISTSNPENMQIQIQNGFSGQKRVVKSLTLNNVLENYARNKQIHFLKIDVEGSEDDVIRSIDFSRYLPWILIIESTFPLTQIWNYSKWENLVLPYYDYVYQDGLNRFYVAKIHGELKASFSSPPNVFDSFKKYDPENLIQQGNDVLQIKHDKLQLKHDKLLLKHDTLIHLNTGSLKNLVKSFWKNLIFTLILRKKFYNLKLSDLPGSYPLLEDGFVPALNTIGSEIVSENHFLEKNFYYWMQYIKEVPRLHNKQFQYYAILSRAFDLTRVNHLSNLSAIGFGVGKEPIPSALVKMGFQVLATDYLDNKISEAWSDTEQMLSQILDLNERKITTDEDFIKRCEFLNLDMNTIPINFNQNFDFVWSTCALGHIGSYQKGLDFILNSLNLLKPGGWAVHTTEIDRSEFESRFESPDLNFYKIEDIEDVLKKASALGFSPLEIKIQSQNGMSEKYVVSEPWGNKPHLRIQIFGREINSIVIQIHRF